VSRERRIDDDTVSAVAHNCDHIVLRMTQYVIMTPGSGDLGGVVCRVLLIMGLHGSQYVITTPGSGDPAIWSTAIWIASLRRSRDAYARVMRHVIRLGRCDRCVLFLVVLLLYVLVAVVM